MIKVCSKCKKPMIYEGDTQKSLCACDVPTNPWECDDEIYPMLKTLWDKGYETDFSCSGHPILTFYGAVSPYVKANVDGNPYISIKASSVLIKDLDKWKYGDAYIRLENSVNDLIHDIGLFVDLPDGWKFNPNDPIIQPYLDMVGEEQAKNLKDWPSDPNYGAHYVIRNNYHINDDDPYLDKYMTLLSDRMDMAKLISILPKNK